MRGLDKVRERMREAASIFMPDRVTRIAPEEKPAVTLAFDSPITVAELREILSAPDINPSATIYSEGCDCTEKSFGIEISDGGNSVTIIRERKS